jgi:3-oxoacyl-[acyl-carrier protein] reductase
MDLGLNGKVALLTGASRGLGFATAKILAQEGVRVAINSRNEAKLSSVRAQLAALGTEVIALPGDVTDPATPAKLVEETLAVLGGLDMLFTNAGGPPPASFEDISEDTWNEAIDLSFMSHVRLIRAALPALRRSEAPSVLTVTSVSVKQPIPNLVLSNSIRAATAGLTKTLALELGGEGIRFNSILPSYTHTERVEELIADRAKRNNTSVEAEIEAQNALSPLGRMGTPEEFGRAAAFLLSPAASYITGVMLTVDGGTYKGLF